MRAPDPSNPDRPTLWGLAGLILLSLVAAAVVIWMTSQ